MINTEQTIPCPVCQSKIMFDTKQLLMGVQFSCPDPTCGASIGLSAESKPLVQNAMDKLDTMKMKMAKK